MSVGADSPFVTPFATCVFRCGASVGVLLPLPVGKQRATCDIDCVQPLAELFERHHDEIAAIIVELYCRAPAA